MAMRKKLIVQTIAKSDDHNVSLVLIWFEGGSCQYKVETDTELHYDGIDYYEAMRAFEKALPPSDSWNLN